MNKGLSEFSLDYIKNTDIKHRQKLGQYFTNKPLRDLALKALPRFGNADIAELSCGSGEFIDDILEYFPYPRVDAIEIDETLANHCLKKYQINDNVKVFHADALDFTFTKKYKYVIGNPPYFEFKPSKKLLGEYEEVIAGRPNIYTFFIKLGVDLLDDGGYLSFVVPTSMLNGAYFSKLRKYIADRCSIVEIIIEGDRQFEGALQNIMILVLKKEQSPSRNFIFEHNGVMIFTPQWKELEGVFATCKTLHELGFKVKTGTVVWNQHKEKLSHNENDTLLVWAHNITNKGFQQSDKKPQYIKGFESEADQVIAVNRITGCGEKAFLKACLIQRDNFVCENHVNVICDTSEWLVLEELLPHIQDPKAISVLRKITGNTQVSKTELEKLLPIWI